MKLYYAPSTCSLAPHIALREFRQEFSLVKFDMRTRLLDNGTDLFSVNGKGMVPVLELDDGQRLTEVAAILQCIADLTPQAHPRSDDPLWKYRVMEWLNFIATEIHKIFWPIFHGGAEDENAKARQKLAQSFAWAAGQLGDRPYLMGEHFSVVDAYFFVVLNWAKPGGVDLSAWPALGDHMRRMRERPAVADAMRAEGLLR
ncbi:glutathione transferase GstA [Trinickia terrae]|uniref:Glutathione transferase GstA n=1 Tax=Trinickia terrae TaxID=2571161 RepID=A0A4U1IF42_9BURK|nr:glutathione transferase GstA [Trinickia terrae]TKC92277.1 glutathione transferase GstA [Trinickia terrae]